MMSRGKVDDSKADHQGPAPAGPAPRHRARRALDDAVEQVAADGKLRRELLWLHAQRQGDQRAVLRLERADPELATRMQGLVLEARARGFDPTAGGRAADAFGWLFRVYCERLMIDPNGDAGDSNA
jgi:hypothetical protein